MVSTSFPSKFRLSKRVHASSLRDLRELHRRYKRHTVDQDAQGQRGLLTDPFPSLPFAVPVSSFVTARAYLVQFSAVYERPYNE